MKRVIALKEFLVGLEASFDGAWFNDKLEFRPKERVVKGVITDAHYVPGNFRKNVVPQWNVVIEVPEEQTSHQKVTHVVSLDLVTLSPREDQEVQ